MDYSLTRTGYTRKKEKVIGIALFLYSSSSSFYTVESRARTTLLVVVTLRINLQAINCLCMPRRQSKMFKATRHDSKPPR